ncbi:hypothetical protein LTR05_000429 [Lithohypha guttulata]|uniref:Uncharacterized protein n=1 Tax=Lithohypha guttulata TaxID=1690604 RepID=A0AAN7YJD8_9EURO|nr:hypothetical protein LTR05_000429 [Lithohypha guttulata]
MLKPAQTASQLGNPASSGEPSTTTTAATVDTPTEQEASIKHFGDWPNAQGVHRFQIHTPSQAGGKVKVTYVSRLTSDGLIEQVKRDGTLKGMTFAKKYEPCKTLFQKLQSFFTPANFLPKKPPKPDEVNIGVTMSVNYPGLDAVGNAVSGPSDQSRILSLCTKTDAAVVQMLDSETLEPLGLAKQEVLHPELKGPVSGAHAKSDPATGDVFNFNLQFGSVGTYKVFRTSASTGKTSILATIRHTTAYLHSIFLTENYVVICIWNSYFKAGGMSILLKQNLIEAMEYNQSAPAKWFVIDKRPSEEGGRGVIATYDSPPFFGFHAVNAYESISDDGVKSIVADIPVYQSMEVLNAFYFENLLSDSPTAGEVQGKWGDSLAPKYRRYRLPDIPNEPREETRHAVQEFELGRRDTPELPTVNWSVFTKKHRYVYGVCDSGVSTFADSLLKLDLNDNSVKRWSVRGQTAGEALFVADPESEDEDGGVLLTIVLDGISGKSYLLVLDAKDLTELGRASVNGAIGFGFHGVHAKAALTAGKDRSLAAHL